MNNSFRMEIHVGIYMNINTYIYIHVYMYMIENILVVVIIDIKSFKSKMGHRSLK